ncbi:hypothetical protein MRX96_055725 [Rhipicephalus microplus]
MEQTLTASPEDYGSEGFCPREDARPGEAGSFGACEFLLEIPDEGDADNDDPEEEAGGYRGDASLEMAIEQGDHGKAAGKSGPIRNDATSPSILCNVGASVLDNFPVLTSTVEANKVERIIGLSAVQRGQPA